MKATKRIFSLILVVVMLVGIMPTQALAAEDGDSYSIANQYIKYTINTKTGGFCIETKEGHPAKSFDNQMPLLYKEDKSRSNGTSFTTVRIDGKDYIFGQDYGWFNIISKTSQPVISNEGRLISVTWSIKGYDITQQVAISQDENNDLTGNIGISYTVKNNNAVEGNVGIRVLLDNALSSLIDGPYVMADAEMSPLIGEVEYSKAQNTMPQQIRYLDSVGKPLTMAYAIVKGWSGKDEITPDKIIVGHWANMANSRYIYTPDSGCDFTNYSNAHRSSDTATAYYWEEKTLAPGAERQAEMLYGIGNFAGELSAERLGIGIAVSSVTLNSKGDGYENDGKIVATINLDNSVDRAGNLADVKVRLTCDEGLAFEKTGTREYLHTIDEMAVGKHENLEVTLVAKKQGQISSKRLVVAVNATEIISAGQIMPVEYSANTNILLPSVSGMLPDIKMTQISPEKVYFEGEKNITVTGKMAEFSVLKSRDGWDLYLVSTATKEEVLVPKKNVAFADEKYETMSFNLDDELTVGSYKIAIKFRDEQLQKSFGSQITAAQELTVTADTKDKGRSYGIVALFKVGTTYDWFSFANEEKLEAFTKGEASANGLTMKNVDKSSVDETLMTVRGKLRQMVDDNGVPFFQGNSSDGSITINSILTYTGARPLNLTADKGGARMDGDGTIKVINSINIWHNKWSFNAINGKNYTLDQEKIAKKQGEEFQLSLDAAGSMVQLIGGFVIDIKYGVLTRYKDTKGVMRPGISFGGGMAFPIAVNQGGSMKSPLSVDVDSVLFGQKGPGKKDNNATNGKETVGFVGIDTTINANLPKDIMGALVQNAFGAYAEIRIDTITNYYRVAFGVELKVIECEGVIAFKGVPINGVERVIPDELAFTLGGDVVAVPIFPPFVSMDSIGGGISELADSFSDEMLSELPPVTLSLGVGIVFLETMVGKFEASISLNGASFDGKLTLRGDEAGKILKSTFGLGVKWTTPFNINAYGEMNVIDGLLKGGFSIKIYSDYFFGHIYARLGVPDFIPVIGGMTIMGVEGAVSSDYIGAAAEVIGIRVGFKYYWDGEFDFGSGISFEAKEQNLRARSVGIAYDTVNGGTYGTNMRKLDSYGATSKGRSAGIGIVKFFDPQNQDAILMEVPLIGGGEIKGENISLTSPSGNKITMVPSDGKGGGNFLVQNRPDGRFLYITITDENLLESGNWTLLVSADDVKVEDFGVISVSNLPAIKSVSYVHEDVKSKELEIKWENDSKSDLGGQVNFYATQDSDIFKKLEQDKTTAENDMAALGELVFASLNKTGSTKITLPNNFPEGKYYIVAMVSAKDGGMSKARSVDCFEFENSELPSLPQDVTVEYGGNGGIIIKAQKPENPNYDTYVVAILDKDGKEMKNGLGEYSAESSEMYFNASMPNSNISLLTPGETYTVAIATRRTTGGEMFCSTGVVMSQPFVMKSMDKPKLVSLESSVDVKSQYSKTKDFKATYTFNQPVKFAPVTDNSPANIKDIEGYKEVWDVELSLEDGENIIDFVAVNENGDKLKGKEDSIFGITVDTQAPVLAVGVESIDSLDSEQKEQTTRARETVFVDKTGKISIKGVTEADATLTLDGSAEGVSIDKDGVFTINRLVDAKTAYGEQILRAVDKAGNETVVTIFIVNRDLTAFDSIKLVSDVDVSNDSQSGVKYVELAVGEKLSLTAYGIKGDKEAAISQKDIMWKVLYEQNIITLKDGQIAAVAPGETAVSASIILASYEGFDGANESVYAHLSDVIVVKVKDLGYRYSMFKTDKYTVFSLMADKSDKFKYVEIDGIITPLLYDNVRKEYRGVFNALATSDMIIKHMKEETDMSLLQLILGDSDNDKTIDNKDLQEAINLFLNGEKLDESDLNKLLRTDMNGDGKVDIVDAQLIKILLLEVK